MPAPASSQEVSILPTPHSACSALDWATPPLQGEERPGTPTLPVPDLKDVLQLLADTGDRKAEHQCPQHCVHGLHGLQRGRRAVPVILLFFRPCPGD